MYGDNKANLEKVNISSAYQDLLFMKSEMEKLSIFSNEDVLKIAIISQKITDKLNQLYEQMKG
jgi:hypothetical protein